MTQEDTVRQLAADRNLRLLKHPSGGRKTPYYKVKDHDGAVIIWPCPLAVVEEWLRYRLGEIAAYKGN
jgi:hypothetical protein